MYYMYIIISKNITLPDLLTCSRLLANVCWLGGGGQGMVDAHLGKLLNSVP